MRSKSGLRLSINDIYQFSRYDNHLAHGLALNKRLDLFGLQGCTFQVSGGGGGGHLDNVAELSVHLNRDFQCILNEQGGVKIWPRNVGQCRRGCPKCRIQFAP